MAPMAIVAGAVAIGLGFYVLSGLVVLLFAQAQTPGGQGEDERRLARFHALSVSYTAGWRKLGLIVALLGYSLAAVALFRSEAASLLWLAAAVGLDCALFFAWRDRVAFTASLSPQECISDASGVAALGFALFVTAILRFSGALS